MRIAPIKRTLIVYAILYAACITWFWFGGRSNTWFDTYNCIALVLVIPVATIEMGSRIGYLYRASWHYIILILVWGDLLALAHWLTIGLADMFELLNVAPEYLSDFLIGATDMGIGMAIGSWRRRHKRRKGEPIS